MRTPAWFIATTTAAVLTIASSHAAAPKFYPDDPLPREPETQDASRAADSEIDLFSDLLVNLFMKPGDVTPGVRARKHQHDRRSAGLELVHESRSAPCR